MTNYTEQLLWKVSTGTLGVLGVTMGFIALFKGVWLAVGISFTAGLMFFYAFVKSFTQDAQNQWRKTQYEKAVSVQKNRKYLKVIK